MKIIFFSFTTIKPENIWPILQISLSKYVKILYGPIFSALPIRLQGQINVIMRGDASCLFGALSCQVDVSHQSEGFIMNLPDWQPPLLTIFPVKGSEKTTEILFFRSHKNSSLCVGSDIPNQKKKLYIKVPHHLGGRQPQMSQFSNTPWAWRD